MLSHIPSLASQKTIEAIPLSFRNNLQWAIPGGVGKASWLTGGFGRDRGCSWEWQVAENEDISAEYISWIFILTSSRLAVRAEEHQVHPPSPCTPRTPCAVKQSLVCWDKREMPFRSMLLTQIGVQTLNYCCCAIAWWGQGIWHPHFQCLLKWWGEDKTWQLDAAREIEDTNMLVSWGGIIKKICWEVWLLQVS